MSELSKALAYGGLGLMTAAIVTSSEIIGLHGLVMVGVPFLMDAAYRRVFK